MKTIFSLWITLLFGFISVAQTGSLLITSLENVSWTPLQNMHVEVFQEDDCWELSSDTSGKTFFRNLKTGYVEVFWHSGDSLIDQTDFYIQENQVYHYKALFDLKKSSKKNIESSRFNYDSNGMIVGRTPRTNDHYDIQEISSIDVKHIDECVVVAYRSPLIQRDAGASGYTITREDITKLPVRSALGIAATVGGVNAIEGTDDYNVRGARTDANVYFIDGIKVRGSSSLPKSAISEVRVITGGIPANYGDVTGGVIDVTTRSSREYRAPYEKRSRKSKNSASSFDYKEYNPEPQINYDRFLPIYENDFLTPLTHPHSTFGLDVDQAAWGFVKQSINQGRIVPRDAVKLEEMVNAFQHKKVEVPEGELLHVEIDRSPCSWNKNNELVSIHLKASDLPKYLPRKSHNFVFLIDVSGSMNSAERLPLLKKGFLKFVETLDKNDRVAIVTYAGNSGVVLPPTTCENKSIILNALDNLTSGGRTNGIGGIKEAYSLAEKHYDPELNNRIILATDGDFNVGINNSTELKNYISEKRGRGIYLTALGFGMGNYKNDILESLAKSGDGNHFYIRNSKDMEKVLITDIGNMLNIARDVKLNVEFNPKKVSNYRLIGYESRLLNPKDFTDDTKDAGEIGYNHQVTAVYEVEYGKAEDVENHFVKTKANFFDSDIAFVKLRYKPMEDSASVERQYHLSSKQQVTANELLNLVIAFGLELKDSAFKGELTTKQLRTLAMNFKATSEEEMELKASVMKVTKE